MRLHIVEDFQQFRRNDFKFRVLSMGLVEAVKWFVGLGLAPFSPRCVLRCRWSKKGENQAIDHKTTVKHHFQFEVSWVNSGTGLL